MHWVIKTAKSAIGVVDPCPYFGGWDDDQTPIWVSKQSCAFRYKRKDTAVWTIGGWGPSWRDAVRVVRLVRRRK